MKAVGEQHFTESCLCDAHRWVCLHPYINLPYLSCAAVGGAISSCSVREDKVCVSNKKRKDGRQDLTVIPVHDSREYELDCFDVRKVWIVTCSTMRHPQESKQTTAQPIRDAACVRGTASNQQSMSQSFKTSLRNRASIVTL